MTDLQFAGFFRELSHGLPDGPSLLESVSPEPHPDEDRIIAYLERGAVLAVSGVLARDVLSEDHTVISVLQTQTDGTWTWSSDLAYYVRTYHARVPAELISHASDLGWVPPELDDDALADVVDRLFGPEEGSTA